MFKLFRKHYRIPHGKTPKTHAQSLLNDVNWYADEINKSREVFDFYYSWKKLDETIAELIWLNEKQDVWMYPTPRDEWNKIKSNLVNTINDFLTRATQYIPFSGEDRADALEDLLYDIESCNEFYSLFQGQNCARLEQFRSEIIAIRKQVAYKKQIEAEELAKKAEIQRKEANMKRLGIDKNIDVSDIDPFEVADSLENTLKGLQEYVLINGLSANDSWKLFSDFKSACELTKLPLAAEIRLEDLLIQYEPKFKEPNTLHSVDNMNGHEFEHWCVGLLLKKGFQQAQVTKASCDNGVDIIAEKDDIRYAIQCKCYKSDLGNKPIQEVHTGKSVYNCHVGAVITNRYFTAGAKQAAEATGTLLWDRDWIINALK